MPQLKEGLEDLLNEILHLQDKLLIRKRILIETVNDPLKNSSQIEHTPRRSIPNFIVNLLSELAAYVHQPKKSSLNINDADFALLQGS